MAYAILLWQTIAQDGNTNTSKKLVTLKEAINFLLLFSVDDCLLCPTILNLERADDLSALFY
jgi:hypothetical protein